MLFAMTEWRMGWHTEVRHWPISRRKRLIALQSEANQKARDALHGDPYEEKGPPPSME